MFSENTFQLLYNITFLKSVFWKTLFKNGAEEFNSPKVGGGAELTVQGADRASALKG